MNNWYVLLSNLADYVIKIVLIVLAVIGIGLLFDVLFNYQMTAWEVFITALALNIGLECNTTSS